MIYVFHIPMNMLLLFGFAFVAIDTKQKSGFIFEGPLMIIVLLWGLGAGPNLFLSWHSRWCSNENFLLTLSPGMRKGEFFTRNFYVYLYKYIKRFHSSNASQRFLSRIQKNLKILMENKIPTKHSDKHPDDLTHSTNTPAWKLLGSIFRL